MDGAVVRSEYEKEVVPVGVVAVPLWLLLRFARCKIGTVDKFCLQG